MSVARPLPERPNLEYERKAAKALLRQLASSVPDAVRRAQTHHPKLRASTRRGIRLADAQLVIAREYGFASWPRLVRYFEEAERLQHRTPSAVNPSLHPPAVYDEVVQRLIARHQRRDASAARALSTFVPRFLDRTLEQVWELAPTAAEAQLVVAREHGYASWQGFLDRVDEQSRDLLRRDEAEDTPLRRAVRAMRAGDLEQLQAVIQAHPELLAPTAYQVATRAHLMAIALDVERAAAERGAAPGAMLAIVGWLVEQGCDLQRALDVRLCGDLRMTPDDVRYWIARGANPDWVAPNGYSVLEHAIVRYRSAAAVDELARHARVTRPALWISAALGDVEGVGRWLDPRGKPLEAARRRRPHLDALSPDAHGAQGGDDDESVLAEAVLLAFLNGRVAVVQTLISRGFPVNTCRWEMPLLVMAVGNRSVEMVAALLGSGADVDLSGDKGGSARRLARELLVAAPEDVVVRRIAMLCGADANAVPTA